MTDRVIYGMARIAEHLEISSSTAWRYQKKGLLDFIEVGSMSNHGGGLGRAAWRWASSLDAVKPMVQARIQDAPSRAAEARWATFTQVRSGSSFG
ncbi:hypothetical protein [Geminicoccus flavidas]|uniref:hypothetical protein n=1 Tax=Geminicoccus flavidas TaxID=2506407 RepID=UPI00135BFC55|nr:hypothetical protein [Geminicoccus flavidas]